MRQKAVYENVIDTSAECPCHILSLQRKQAQNKGRSPRTESKREKLGLWVKVDGFRDFMPLDLQIEPAILSCLRQNIDN